MEVDKVINMNKMVSECHLKLLLSFVEISIQHLENSIFGVDFSIVILLEDLDFLLQLLCLGKSKQLSPMCKNFHSIEMCHLLLLDHLILKSFLSHLDSLLLFVSIFLLNIFNVSDTNLNVMVFWTVGLPFDNFS